MKRWQSSLLRGTVFFIVAFIILKNLADLMYVQAMHTRSKTYCLLNYKGLGKDIMMYVQDYDGRLPYPATSFTSLILPYTKNYDAIKCPLDVHGLTSYMMNRNLQGLLLKDIEKPERVVLLYEGTKGQVVARHQGCSAVVFADGHAKMINEEEVKDLVWKVTPPPTIKKATKKSQSKTQERE